ncbi:hypothetical protein [Phaeovulum sp. NW3]|uniref:hypothetical protein n=1 Tax=Phaeovulum sp. NW3 TaxID=2934933 RepID=UPI00202164C9|nr:hypothetical protein [Phaeovulum sp. NW3]MCL7466296.1 hypothetical protein [Phaeovulum sp. NW3]
MVEIKGPKAALQFRGADPRGLEENMPTAEACCSDATDQKTVAQGRVCERISDRTLVRDLMQLKRQGVEYGEEFQAYLGS